MGFMTYGHERGRDTAQFGGKVRAIYVEANTDDDDRMRAVRDEFTQDAGD